MRIKPDLSMYFAQMPFIGKYMEQDYNNANTVQEMTDLCHKWNNEAEISKNLVRKTHYQAGANFLYTLLTGKSFESKNLEIIN